MPCHNQRFVSVGLEQLVRIGKSPGAIGVRKRALGKVGIRGLQCLTHAFDADAVAVQLLWIDLNAYRGPGSPPSEYLADTRDLRDFLGEDGIGSVVDLRDGNGLRGQRKQPTRRLSGIDFAVGRLGRQIGRQLASSGVDGRFYIAGRRVNVTIQVELKRNSSAAER